MYSFFDGHCDTITEAFAKGEDLFDFDGHINIKKLLFFQGPVQTFAIWINGRRHSDYYTRTMKIIDFFYEQMERHKNYIAPAYNRTDIEENKRQNKISAMLSLEGGEALEGNLSRVEEFYRKGVRSITLTWNHSNVLAGGIGAPKDNGLTPFGKEVVKEMDRLGMMVDVSHLGERSFWDVCQISQKPIVASHSNSRSICFAKRNLTDDQVKAIVKKRGVIGVSLYGHFLREGSEAKMDDVFRHIRHIIDLTGDRHVGLGCDFDGIDRVPVDMNDVTDISRLAELLYREWGESTAQNILEKNFLRVLQEVAGN